MTEKQFWCLVNEIQAKNRPKLLAMECIHSDDPLELEEAKRIDKENTRLGEDLEDLTYTQLKEAAQLIFDKNVSLKCKEMIIMSLAHSPYKFALKTLRKYNNAPDKELRYFSEFALQECQWNSR